MRLQQDIVSSLRCPVCKSTLELSERGFLCTNTSCQATFPIVDGIPVLINESASVFSIRDFTEHQNTFFQSRPNKVNQLIGKLLPTLDHNISTKKNYGKFAELLAAEIRTPKVLILGGSIVGRGLDEILSHPSIQFIETDVSFGPRTALVCDAHNIPFDDRTFDGVIAQAVLEHVVDPYRCVAEIHRVLKDSGCVYAETPFMQQVHAGRYDFTRFTLLGHRRLFRRFEEIESGAVDGPGMALGWSYKYFVLSFARSRLLRSILSGFARLTAFWLKYFDYYLIKKPGTLDAASGFYFLGRKSDKTLSDKNLVSQYRGSFG